MPIGAKAGLPALSAPAEPQLTAGGRLRRALNMAGHHAAGAGSGLGASWCLGYHHPGHPRCDRRGEYPAQITFWLWFTVVFANFAGAVAEGRGRAQADNLRRMRTQAKAKRLTSADGESYESVWAPELKQGDHVLVEAGEFIPSDGDVVEGIASVDEPTSRASPPSSSARGTAAIPWLFNLCGLWLDLLRGGRVPRLDCGRSVAFADSGKDHATVGLKMPSDYDLPIQRSK